MVWDCASWQLPTHDSHNQAISGSSRFHPVRHIITQPNMLSVCRTRDNSNPTFILLFITDFPILMQTYIHPPNQNGPQTVHCMDSPRGQAIIRCLTKKQWQRSLPTLTICLLTSIMKIITHPILICNIVAKLHLSKHSSPPYFCRIG